MFPLQPDAFVSVVQRKRHKIPEVDLVVGWRDTWAGVVRKSVMRWSSPDHWQTRSRVNRGLTLPDLPRGGEVWAITMVKNEADILDATVRHLFTQGVDRALIVDNDSTDATANLLKDLARDLPVFIGQDRETGYYQAHKMTTLARAARGAGAKWVIPFDADEFWFAPGMTIRDYLAGQAATRVEATMYNAFPTRTHPSIKSLDSPARLDLSPHLLPKVSARTHPLLWIGMGNHTALRPGLSTDGLKIVHVPWRSSEQFIRKIRQGANALRATDLADELGGHWRSQDKHSDTALNALWNDVLDGAADPAIGWHPVGPFIDVQLSTWETWDPDELISADIPRQYPTF